MSVLQSLWNLANDVLASGVLYKLLLLVVVLVMLRGGYRIQRSADNRIDFFDFIRDPVTQKLSPVRAFYCAGAVSSLIVYAIACTRPNATIAEINTFTWSYACVWAASQVANRFVERAPSPIVAAAPPAPGVTVNMNAQGGAP